MGYGRLATRSRVSECQLLGGPPNRPLERAPTSSRFHLRGALRSIHCGFTGCVTVFGRLLHSVQYTNTDQTRVVLGRSGGSAVTVGNVAAGTEATDAVNVAQLRNGLTDAIQQSNAYTDLRMAVLSYSLEDLRRVSYAGTAGALAAAALPQIAEPGKSMFAVGAGTYEGQSSMAIGYS